MIYRIWSLLTGREKILIYRKWSLLPGPAVILAGIVGTVVVTDLLFDDNVVSYEFISDRKNEIEYLWKLLDGFIISRDWLRKTDQKKQESATSTK